MADERIRRQLAFLAAQMMYNRTESEYFTAKRKAAKQLGVKYRHRPGDLPSNKEIRDQIQAMARIHEGPKRLDRKMPVLSFFLFLPGHRIQELDRQTGQWSRGEELGADRTLKVEFGPGDGRMFRVARSNHLCSNWKNLIG